MVGKGYANNRFYHALATSMKKENHISCLEADSEECINDHECMCHIVQVYYECIFKAPGHVKIEESEPVISISEKQNRKLVKKVSFEEFTVVVK